MKNVTKILALLLMLVLLCGAMTSCMFLPENLIEFPEWNFTGLDPLLSLIFGESFGGSYQNESGTIRYEFNGENVTIILFQSEYEEILNGTGLTYEGQPWMGGSDGTAIGGVFGQYETNLPDGVIVNGEKVIVSDVVLVDPNGEGEYVYDSESGVSIGGNLDNYEIYYNSSLLLSKVMILQGTYEIDDEEIYLKLDMSDDEAISYVASFFAGLYSFAEDNNGDIYIGSDRLIKVD